MARILNEIELSDIVNLTTRPDAILIGVSAVHKGYRYKAYQLGESFYALLETEDGEAVLCEEVESKDDLLRDYIG